MIPNGEHMTAPELLAWWCAKAVEQDHIELDKLDALVLDVVTAAKREGISRDELDAAAGGNVRTYFRDAILAGHSDIDPPLGDVLGRNEIG